MTAQPPTIPAAHLDALGFTDNDQPVQTMGGSGVARNTWDHLLATHPRMLLDVERSMGTLLRALARSYGAKLEDGEVPTWGRNIDGERVLGCEDGFERAFTPTPRTSTSAMQCRVFGRIIVPALADDMGRIEAAAAVIAWKVGQ